MQDKDCDVKDVANSQDSICLQAVNPNVFISEFANPTHTYHDKQEVRVVDGQYPDTNIHKSDPTMKGGSSTTEKMSNQMTIHNADGKEWIGIYDLATTPSTTESLD